MMDVTKLTKAQKAFDELKAIDQEVIEIEKMAALIADGTGDVAITIKANAAKEESGCVATDHCQTLEEMIRSSVSRSIDRGILSISLGKSKDSDEIKIKVDPTPTVVLQVLSVLIYHKNQRRETIISNLQSMGVQI